MTRTFIIISMLFCHVFADFNLQGILAQLKQKQWWISNGFTDKLYRHDYVTSLLIHSFQWSCIMMLPLMIKYNFQLDWFWAITLVANTSFHATIDDTKANDGDMSLTADQFFHVLQVIYTYFIITEYMEDVYNLI